MNLRFLGTKEPQICPCYPIVSKTNLLKVHEEVGLIMNFFKLCISKEMLAIFMVMWFQLCSILGFKCKAIIQNALEVLRDDSRYAGGVQFFESIVIILKVATVEYVNLELSYFLCLKL